MNSLILFIYIVGFVVSYFVIRHKWEDKPLSEQLWYAVAWPGTLMVYIIYLLSRK